MKVPTCMVVPIPITLHAKSNSGWRRIGTGVLASRVPGPVIRGKGLTSDNTMLEGAMSEIGVVLKGHDDGGNDDEDSSWTTTSFIFPEVVPFQKWFDLFLFP